MRSVAVSRRLPGWRAERWLALALSAAVLAAQLGTGFASRIDQWLFDHGSLRVLHQPSERVALLLVPPDFTRARQAELIDALVAAQAKVIVDLLPLSTSQASATQASLTRLRQLVQTALPADNVVQLELTQLLNQGEAQDGDQRLATSLARAHNVVLAGVCQPQDGTAASALPAAEAALPAFAVRSSLKATEGLALEARCADWPLARFGAAAWAVGQRSNGPQADGLPRHEALLLSDQGRALPSVALLAALRSLDLDLDDLQVEPGRALQLGPLRVPTGAHALLWPRRARTRDGAPVFPQLSAEQLLASPSSPSSSTLPLAGRVLLLAPNDAPAAAELLAQTLASLLDARVLQSRPWAPWLGGASVVGVLALLLAGAGAALLPAALTLGAGVLLLLGAEFALLLGGLLVPLALPALLLAFALAALLLRRIGQPLPLPASNAPQRRAHRRSTDRPGPAGVPPAAPGLASVPLSPSAPQAPTAGAHAPPVPPATAVAPVPPQLLGPRYRLERELARGSMGVVYLGHDLQTGRVVAIKSLSLSQEFDGAALDDARARFFREAETAGRLQHPNIVQIHDCGEFGELAYIAMEYVPGQTLQAFCQQGQLLGQDQVLAIAAQVASALAYAHQHNVVHRDIKPANILYTPANGTVKVSDFGVARILDQSRTRTGLVLGTPSYMSPEQVAGRRVDGQSDLYSLGVMLYQMLTGVLPFYGQSLAELMHRIASDEAPDIRQVRPELPAPLAAIVARLLRKQPDQRAHDGAQLASELHALMRPPVAPVTVAINPAVETHSATSDSQADSGWAATLTLPKKP